MDDGLTSKRGREETLASPPPMTTFDATQCHIEMLSPEATARATVDFSTLMLPDGNGGTHSGSVGSVGSTRLASILDTEGFAVVTNVLSAAEVKHAEKLWGSDLMSIVDVRPETAMADPMSKFTGTPWKKEVSAAAKAKKERKKEKRNAARSAHAHNSTSGNALDEHATKKHQPATVERKEGLSQGLPDGTKRSIIPEARGDDDEDAAVPSSWGVERSGTCEQSSKMIESQRAATYMKHVRDLGADPVHRWPLESFPLVARQGVAKFTTDYGLPHGEMAWFCRRHAHVKTVFEAIFRTTELCCGFDVIFFNNRPVVVRPNTTVAAAHGIMKQCGDRGRSADEHCEVNEDVPIARPSTSGAERQSTRGGPTVNEEFGTDRSCHGVAAPAASSPGARSKFGFPAMDTEQPPVFVDNLRALTTTLWPHADQNAHVPPAGTNQVYQSVLYLWPADEASSSTIVWPGSHRTVFPRLMETVNHDRHYCALPAASPESAATVGTVGAATAVNETRGGVEAGSSAAGLKCLKPERMKAPPRAVSSHGELAPDGELPEATREAFVQHARRVPVPPGGMVIWDSRTLHQGWPHGRRLALPIGFEPTSRRSSDVLAAKQRLVLDGVPTDHWGSLGAQHRMARGPGKQKPTPGLTLAHAAHRRAHLMSADGTLRPDVVQIL